jgi:hypothetical protein
MEQNERRLRAVIGAVFSCQGRTGDCDQCWAESQVHNTSPTVCAMVQALEPHINATPESVTHVRIGLKVVKVH